eukprot:8622306-Alexandrium_andersonii.AAC.1
MSASLVGSEMCIRDRSAPALPSPGASPKQYRHCGSPTSHLAWSPGWGICLLYTSDAADDM